MLTYGINYFTGALPALRGQAFDPDAEPFCRRPCADIGCYVWPGDYRPEARAYAAWNEEGLHLLLCARERTVSAKTTMFNGPVYQDSCLEFFFGMEGSSAYMNIEVNAAGCALIGFGTDRERRACLPELPEGMNIRASRHEGGWWAVAYTVPSALIESLFGKAPSAGMALRGNFYCCDETLHPHFGSWSPIQSPEPDFHRPECFGKLYLER